MTVCVVELGILGTVKLYHTNIITMLALKYLAFTNGKLVIATIFFCFH